MQVVIVRVLLTKKFGKQFGTSFEMKLAKFLWIYRCIYSSLARRPEDSGFVEEDYCSISFYSILVLAERLRRIRNFKLQFEYFKTGISEIMFSLQYRVVFNKLPTVAKPLQSCLFFFFSLYLTEYSTFLSFPYL